MKPTIKFLFGCVCLLTVGCYTVPLATREADHVAKQLKPDNEKALIYVYNSGCWGVFSPIKANNKIIARLDYDTYLYFFSYQGQLTLAARTVLGGNNDRTIQIDVRPGSTYYANLNATCSKFGKDHFNLVSASVGEKEMSSMKLAAMREVPIIHTGEGDKLLAIKREEGGFKLAVSLNSYTAYSEFLHKYPSSSRRRDVLSKMVICISNQSGTFKDYEKFVDEYADGSELIPVKYRLRLVGPVGLRIEDIIVLRNKGVEDNIIVAKIQSQKNVYKDFDSEEIILLKKMGISGDIIAAMFQSTAVVKRQQEQEQEEYRRYAMMRAAQEEGEERQRRQEEAERQTEIQRDRQEQQDAWNRAAKSVSQYNDPINQSVHNNQQRIADAYQAGKQARVQSSQPTAQTAPPTPTYIPPSTSAQPYSGGYTAPQGGSSGQTNYASNQQPTAVKPAPKAECNDMTHAVTAKIGYHKNAVGRCDGQMEAFMTNSASESVSCDVIGVKGGVFQWNDGMLAHINSGQTLQGEWSGMFWCGYGPGDTFKFKCVLKSDDDSCKVDLVKRSRM